MLCRNCRQTSFEEFPRHSQISTITLFKTFACQLMERWWRKPWIISLNCFYWWQSESSTAEGKAPTANEPFCFKVVGRQNRNSRDVLAWNFVNKAVGSHEFTEVWSIWRKIESSGFGDKLCRDWDIDKIWMTFNGNV